MSQDPRTPEQIWEAGCLAMIQEMRLWGYDIRPFVTPVPYKAPEGVQQQINTQLVKIKKEHELPGAKGARYRVLLTQSDDSFIQNVNENHPDAHKFWIKNSKIEPV